MKGDKGQFVKKKNADGTINEAWLEIHRPNQAKKNKLFWKMKGQAFKCGGIVPKR